MPPRPVRFGPWGGYLPPPHPGPEFPPELWGMRPWQRAIEQLQGMFGPESGFGLGPMPMALVGTKALTAQAPEFMAALRNLVLHKLRRPVSWPVLDETLRAHLSWELPTEMLRAPPAQLLREQFGATRAYYAREMAEALGSLLRRLPVSYQQRLAENPDLLGTVLHEAAGIFLKHPHSDIPPYHHALRLIGRSLGE